MTANQWFSGKTCGPKLISLENGFSAAPPKDFVTSAVAPPAVEEVQIVRSQADVFCY
jgi:hypothetical protein